MITAETYVPIMLALEYSSIIEYSLKRAKKKNVL